MADNFVLKAEIVLQDHDSSNMTISKQVGLNRSTQIGPMDFTNIWLLLIMTNLDIIKIEGDEEIINLKKKIIEQYYLSDITTKLIIKYYENDEQKPVEIKLTKDTTVTMSIYYTKTILDTNRKYLYLCKFYNYMDFKIRSYDQQVKIQENFIYNNILDDLIHSNRNNNIMISHKNEEKIIQIGSASTTLKSAPKDSLIISNQIFFINNHTDSLIEIDTEDGKTIKGDGIIQKDNIKIIFIAPNRCTLYDTDKQQYYSPQDESDAIADLELTDDEYIFHVQEMLT